MIQTINPYATARTAVIMSRYRPIAPKPEAPAAAANNSAAENDNSALPTGIRKSPYLSNVWAHLQARPTRTRKRGRSAAFGPPPAIKRTRTCLQGLSPPPAQYSPANNLAMHGFTHTTRNMISQISVIPNFAAMKCGSLDAAVTTLAESVALPLFIRGGNGIDLNAFTAADPAPPVELDLMQLGESVALPLFIRGGNGIDLNAFTAVDQAPPVELDLLPQLHHKPVEPVVISPRPVRPVGSSITVNSISPGDRGSTPVEKAASEVEDELETDADPAVVSDSNNKVRICNSAYKVMVGQPECCWLDCAAGMRCGGGACKRIGGEVSLRFVDSKVEVETAAFSCLVRIEWEREGKKVGVNASCTGVKLACEGKDYQFLWRFNMRGESSKVIRKL